MEKVEKMKTIIANLQKYYGVYLLIVAVLFLILWFPNRAVNRYAVIEDPKWGICVIDTRTGQDKDWHYDLVTRYAGQWREARQAGDNDRIAALKKQMIEDANLNIKDAQEIVNLVKNNK